MHLTVMLFAGARVRAGSSSVEVELAGPGTVADLKHALILTCPALANLIPSSRIAVNASYADDGDLIPLGAEVALIPPVSGGSPDHRISVSISSDEIDHAAITDSVRSDQAGAVCSFLGTVREMTGTRRTVALEYEAYAGMAEQTLTGLANQALERWPLERVAIAHRLGPLGLGEISVVVAVSCPHRVASFESCQWLMDTLKSVVPIWKKEVWADGTEEWVHPGAG